MCIYIYIHVHTHKIYIYIYKHAWPRGAIAESLWQAAGSGVELTRRCGGWRGRAILRKKNGRPKSIISFWHLHVHRAMGQVRPQSFASTRSIQKSRKQRKCKLVPKTTFRAPGPQGWRGWRGAEPGRFAPSDGGGAMLIPAPSANFKVQAACGMRHGLRDCRIHGPHVLHGYC